MYSVIWSHKLSILEVLTGIKKACRKYGNQVICLTTNRSFSYSPSRRNTNSYYSLATLYLIESSALTKLVRCTFGSYFQRLIYTLFNNFAQLCFHFIGVTDISIFDENVRKDSFYTAPDKCALLAVLILWYCKYCWY